MRLAPKTFWAMSLAEWRAATVRSGHARPLGHAELETMMKEHPDART